MTRFQSAIRVAVCVVLVGASYYGGEIYFDDSLVRKDGRFVLPDLEALNPEHLRSP